VRRSHARGGGPAGSRDSSHANPGGGTLVDRIFQSLVELTERMGSARRLDEAAAAIVDYALTHLGADLAGITTWEPGGRPVRLAGSSLVLTELDRVEARLAHGPGTGGLQDGAAITIADTTTEKTWRDWSEAAASHDVHSVRLVGMPPMRSRSMCLELYSHRPRAFTTGGLVVTRRVAKHAGITLRQIDRALNLEEALETRALIGQAQGILMERYHLTSEQAMSFLRRTSQQTQIKVRDLADSVVTGRESVLDTIALTSEPSNHGGEEETG
jgi:hypothetical protein